MSTNHNVPSSSATMDNVARAVENFSAATNELNQALLAATLAPNAVPLKGDKERVLPDELIRRAQGWQGISPDYVHYILPPVIPRNPEVEAQLLRNIFRVADEESMEYHLGARDFVHCNFTINGFKFVVLVTREAAEVLHVV